MASLAPSAAGDTNTWDSGAYTDIDEIVLDDTDMLKSGTAAQEFNCNLTDLPAGDFDVAGVKVTARAVKGVQQTVVLPPLTPPYGFKPLGGVAVIANSTWAAMKGREKLKVEWDPGENAGYDSAKYKAAPLETVRKPQTYFGSATLPVARG